MDLQFAEGIGVNIQDLLFVQPNAAEQGPFYLQECCWQVCTRSIEGFYLEILTNVFIFGI